MGIGGGFLLTIYNKLSGTAEVLNARECAPIAATKEMFGKPSDEGSFFVLRYTNNTISRLQTLKSVVYPLLYLAN